MKGSHEKMDTAINAIRSAHTECEETINKPMKAPRKELGGDMHEVNDGLCKEPRRGTQDTKENFHEKFDKDTTWLTSHQDMAECIWLELETELQEVEGSLGLEVSGTQ
jgi:hypothetical protein